MGLADGEAWERDHPPSSHYWRGMVGGKLYEFADRTGPEIKQATPEMWEMAYEAFRRVH